MTQQSLGMETLSIFIDGKRMTHIRDEKYHDEIDEDYKDLFIVKENFPYINSFTRPSIRTMLAPREGFIFAGLLLENDLEIILRDNLLLLSNFKISLNDNFDELIYPPVDTYPNQVRSDIKEYLKNIKKGVIGRMELNYTKSFEKKHF